MGKGEPLYPVGEKHSGRSLKNWSRSDPVTAVPLLGVALKDAASHQQGHFHIHAHCCSIHNSQEQNQPRCPSTGEGNNKNVVPNTHGHCFSCKEK